MVSKILTGLILLLLFVQCSNEPLEKQNVPFFLSIATDEPVNIELIKKSSDSLKYWNIKGYTVIVNYENDSLAQENIKNTILLLKNINTPFNLQIEFSSKIDTLTPEHLKFFYEVLAKVKTLNKNPERVLVKLRSQYTFSLDEIISYIRKTFPKTKISIFAKLYDIEKLRSYDFDEFAYQYDYPPLQLSYRAIAHRLHPVIEEKISKTNKGLFLEIFLMKKDADKQLKNLLRFWSKDFPLTGISISTIYGKPVLVDSTSPLGLQNDYKLKNFLKNYGKNSDNTP